MTGTNTIPEDWDVHTLDEVSVKIQDGTHFSPTLGGSEYRYITSRNIGNGRLRLDSVEMISESEHRKIYRRCDTRFGDLLLTKDGANTGNAAINSFMDEISLLSSVAFIRANYRQATEGYLLQYLLSGAGRKQIDDAMAGNAITRLTLAKIKALRVPMPRVEEQQRIASALADADELIAALERLIAKKQAVKQAMMQQLLTGRTRLPGFDQPWSEVTIGDLAGVTGGGTPSTRISSLWGGGIPWFTPAEIPESGAGVVTTSGRTITEAGLQKSAAKLLPEGTVLVTSRASIGNCAVAGCPVATNQGFTSLVPSDRRSTEFLYYWVQQHRSRFVSRAAGSTFLEISGSKVAAIEILAPAAEEQAAIGAVLSDADAELRGLQQRLTKAQDVKQGMMQQLLTGRTRLAVEAVV
ncbi:restriction endonuclease subunit S [Micrococcus luteus]|uniref:restriction endonuclease subunit S n=1 Tax=Micrococcus luteus TaxID=1270 RepID=UPI0020044EF6|nr:restriction endonuclease subunit S [Micrococcus luteus]MCK6062579.1 restriction endonuclease subunit S [Micrococcus luteus]MCK6064861.1 restriction endonuclease subunit S [Micrococcus luteus]MCK6193253.1 restriction endonuclease subunit S [Micrococcus luteus]MCK6195436.1 restriction endonuclease subunit S [Micrococcus luteus]